jgi:Arc/MetJ-type ribon-helix-helix transcriptional regulator
MSAEPAHDEEQHDPLQELLRCVHALETHTADELVELLTSPGLEDQVRRAIEAVATFRMIQDPRLAPELAPMLAARHGGPGAASPDVILGRVSAEISYAGPARKVSVSMPEDLTVAVQRRVGRGKFSQYVTEAVTRRLELDLLAELSEMLAAEYGPVPEEYLAEARAAWPDDE